MRTAKEIYETVRALFVETVPPGVPPVAPPVVAPIAASTYKLKNGTEISIAIAGTELGLGDTVTVAGVAAPAGEYELEDGTKITIDATGAIAVITPAEPVTVDLAAPIVPPIAPPVQTQMSDIPNTPEKMRALYTAFAVGTPEDRLANLELATRAVMEYCFALQTREVEQKAAMAAHKQGLDTAQNTLATAQATIAAQKTELESQRTELESHKVKIEGMFNAFTELMELPTADPKTLNGQRKDQFERAKTKEKAMERIAAAMVETRKEKAKA